MYTPLEDIEKEKRYCGITAWHNNGVKGDGVVIWNTESEGSSHGDIVSRRIWDSCPNATIIQAGLYMLCDNERVIENGVDYQGKRYGVEEFIKTFNVNILTRSVGGGDSGGKAESRFWLDLIDRYNLVIFNSAGNEGGKGISSAFPNDVAFFVGSVCLNRAGVPMVLYYSSRGESLDFVTFRGVWDGTSFSAPFLAGISGLLKQRFGKMSWFEIYECLKMISMDIDTTGFDINSGNGLPILPTFDKKYIQLIVDSNKYYVNGQGCTMDTVPVNKEGNVFVPLRVVSETLGVTPVWNTNSDKSITISLKKGDNVATFTTGSTIMFKNGTKIMLPFAPYIDGNSRTLVPVRAISEALGCKVGWVQKDKKVIIWEV